MATRGRPNRGEVWLVDFDPAVSAEIRKRRPAVVLNLDGLGRLPLRIVVPITDWKAQFASFSWFIHIPARPSNGLLKDSGADAFQVKSVAERRFIRRLGELADAEIEDIASAIALCVGAP